MHHTCSASTRCSMATICICARSLRVSELVGGIKAPPAQVTLSQDQQDSLGGTKASPPHSYNQHHHMYHLQLYHHHECVPPPHTTTTTQCKLHEWKCSICASGWKEKHHQRKLHQVIATTCASAVLVLVDGEKRPPLQVAKGQDQHWCKLEWAAPTTCNYNHHHHWPCRLGPARVLFEWPMQRQCNLCKVKWCALMQVALISASVQHNTDTEMRVWTVYLQGVWTLPQIHISSKHQQFWTSHQKTCSSEL